MQHVLYIYMYLSKALSTSSGNKLLPDEAINITRWIRFQYIHVCTCTIYYCYYYTFLYVSE